jgi:hypothetical protein
MIYIPLVSALITVIFSALVSIPSLGLLLNSATQKEISDLYPTLITPAGITFSIWSLIYISFIAVGIAIALRKVVITDAQAIWFSAAMLVSSIWLVPWAYQYMTVSLVIMVCILAILIYLFQTTRTTDVYFRYTIELFLGWICIATVANVSIWLMYMGYDQVLTSLTIYGYVLTPVIWAIGILGVALAINAGLLFV